MRFVRRRGLPGDVPWLELDDETRRLVWAGEPGGRQSWKTKWYGLEGFFKWLEARSYKMHVRVLLSRYRRYVSCPACARRAAQARGAAAGGSRGARCPTSRRSRSRDSEAFFAGLGAARPATRPPICCSASSAQRLRVTWSTWGSATSTLDAPVAHALGRRGAARDARRRRSAARSPARSSCSTSRRSACTRGRRAPRARAHAAGGGAATRSSWSSTIRRVIARRRPRDRARPGRGARRAASSSSTARSRGCCASRASRTGALRCAERPHAAPRAPRRSRRGGCGSSRRARATTCGGRRSSAARRAVRASPGRAARASARWSIDIALPAACAAHCGQRDVGAAGALDGDRGRARRSRRRARRSVAARPHARAATPRPTPRRWDRAARSASPRAARRGRAG